MSFQHSSGFASGRGQQTHKSCFWLGGDCLGGGVVGWWLWRRLHRGGGPLRAYIGWDGMKSGAWLGGLAGGGAGWVCRQLVAWLAALFVSLLQSVAYISCVSLAGSCWAVSCCYFICRSVCPFVRALAVCLLVWFVGLPLVAFACWLVVWWFAGAAIGSHQGPFDTQKPIAAYL